MQPEILSFVDDLRALGMTDPPRKHWLFQPTVTVCRWQDPETGTVYGLRPPLPLATDQQWLSYGADFIDPLLRRHHGDQRLQLHSRLVQEVMAWRSAQPPELRVWREDPTAGPTDPLEWLYNENPWIAAELETVLVDREFWRGRIRRHPYRSSSESGGRRLIQGRQPNGGSIGSRRCGLTPNFTPKRMGYVATASTAISNIWTIFWRGGSSFRPISDRGGRGAKSLCCGVPA